MIIYSECIRPPSRRRSRALLCTAGQKTRGYICREQNGRRAKNTLKCQDDQVGKLICGLERTNGVARGKDLLDQWEAGARSRDSESA